MQAQSHSLKEKLGKRLAPGQRNEPRDRNTVQDVTNVAEATGTVACQSPRGQRKHTT